MGGREEPVECTPRHFIKTFYTHLFPRNIIPGEAYHKRQVHFFELAMALPK